jgi:integrase
MARIKTPFTDKGIAALQGEEKKYREREGKGFGIRVMPSGVKTFIFMYDYKGKRKEMSLGNYPEVKSAEARQRYRDACSLFAKGIDPQEHHKVIAEAETKEANDTFGYFAKGYIEWSDKNHSKAWHKTVRMSLNNDVIPLWHDTPIASIKRRDATALLNKIAERAPGQAKNVLKATRAVFEYAIENDQDIVNPFLKLSKAIPALKPITKDRILSDNEIRSVWQAIDEGSGDERTKSALKLILVTAQRPVEITSMHRNQIDGNWWTLQSKDVKNNVTHRVYLTPTALRLIGDNEGYIFPSYKVGDNQEARPIVRQTLSQSVVGHRYYGLLTTWTPHDLRRTARTIMARIGIQEAHAEAILNHKKQGVVKVYNLHQYDKEKQEAMLLWEMELLRLIS